MTLPTDYPLTVAALYHFAPIAEPQAVRDALHALCEGDALCGTLLIAHEGVNGRRRGKEAIVGCGIADGVGSGHGWCSSTFYLMAPTGCNARR